MAGSYRKSRSARYSLLTSALRDTTPRENLASRIPASEVSGLACYGFVLDGWECDSERNTARPNRSILGQAATQSRQSHISFSMGSHVAWMGCSPDIRLQISVLPETLRPKRLTLPVFSPVETHFPRAASPANLGSGLTQQHCVKSSRHRTCSSTWAAG
jgi:hypothetical protein